MTTTEHPPPSKGLRWWLILLTIIAVIVFGRVLLCGWAVNLDTMYDLGPLVDPQERQDAIEQRIFFWAGITLFGLMLASGVVGGWMARRRKRDRLALRLSPLAAGPIFLCIVFFTLAAGRGASYWC